MGLSVSVSFLLVGVAAAQQGTLFPQPFVVEHHVVQVDASGARFTSETVTDYYGGSWLVSVRPDGSRLILDFARREMTEVRPSLGSYWTASFERIGELAARTAASEWRGMRRVADDGEAERRMAAGATETPELLVEELPVTDAAQRRPAAASSTGFGSPTGLVRVRVVERQRSADPDAGLEVWLDPSIRLAAPALTALSSFEESVGAAAERREVGATGNVARQLAAARAHAGGALPVRTSRSLAGRGTAAGRLADVATRVERLDELPSELLTIPEGLRRVPHPMEAAVAFLEAEAERDRAMSGDREQ